MMSLDLEPRRRLFDEDMTSNSRPSDPGNPNTEDSDLSRLTYP